MIERTVTLSFTIHSHPVVEISAADVKDALISEFTKTLGNDGVLTYLDVMVTDEEVSE